MQQSANVLPNVRPEPVEDVSEVEQMEPETYPVTAASEIEGTQEETNVKSEETEEIADEENAEKKPTLCTMNQLTRLAKQIGKNWKLLAPKLGFGQDEVRFIFKISNFISPPNRFAGDGQISCSTKISIYFYYL